MSEYQSSEPAPVCNKATPGNIIFECDDKLPSCLENIMHLFHVIKRQRKEECASDLDTIIAMMSNSYNVNEAETRRCVASLYMDGAINIVKDPNNIVLSLKLYGKKNYPALLREKIRVIFLSTICQMYMKMNLQIANDVSEFSVSQLIDYFAKEAVKMPRIGITEELMTKMLDKLSRSGFLNKNDDSMYSMTNKTVKFGLKIEEFSKYCTGIKVEKIRRHRQARDTIERGLGMIRSLEVDKSYNDRESLSKNCNGVLKEANMGPLIFPHIESLVPKPTFNHLNIVPPVVDSGTFSHTVLPITLNAIPVFSQVIQSCNMCGQSSNENGIIWCCVDCGIYAHIVCKQFFNCPRATKWCLKCRNPFQMFVEKFEDVCIVCRDCLSRRQTLSDLCTHCQRGVYEDDEATLRLEHLELKQSIDYMLSKDNLSSLSQPHTGNVGVIEEYVPSTLSFVEMLNDNEEKCVLPESQWPPVHVWTVKDVEKWLIDEGYGQLCQRFRNEEIDGNSLMLLLETDLTLMKVDKKLVSQLYSKVKKLK